MCVRCVLEADLAQLEHLLAAAEVNELERTADVAAGLVPEWARRGLLPHERAAGVNFATLDTSTGSIVDRIRGRLAAHRSRIVDAIERQLAEATTPAAIAAVARRIADPARPISADVEGYDELTARVANDIAGDLADAYIVGVESVRAEADAQGVPTHDLARVVPPEQIPAIERQAAASAAGPASVVTQAVTAATGRLPLETAPVADSRRALVDAARSDYDARLGTDYAATPAQQATAGARIDALGRLPEAARYYASELLDGNTCGPCSMIDGTDYETLDDAEADYPGGTYIDCEGGDRCRGTVVTVWYTETPATVQ